MWLESIQMRQSWQNWGLFTWNSIICPMLLATQFSRRRSMSSGLLWKTLKNPMDSIPITLMLSLENIPEVNKKIHLFSKNKIFEFFWKMFFSRWNFNRSSRGQLVWVSLEGICPPGWLWSQGTLRWIH